MTGTGQEAGHVNERYQRNVEGVAEAYKAATLLRGVHVEHTGHAVRLVGNNAHRLAVEAGKAHDDVLGKVLVYLEELAVIDDGADHLIHVIGVIGALGDDVVQRILNTVDGIGALNTRCLLHVVAGHVAQQLADDGDGLFLGLGGKVCHTALAGVNTGTAQLLLGHVLAGHGLDNLGTGQEHERDALGHDDEVGQGRRVNSTTGTRAQDSADLGNHARCIDIALENLGISGKGIDALLNAGTTRVIQANHWCTLLHGQIHHLTHL